MSQNGLTMSFSPQSIEEGATTQDIGVSVRSDNNDKSIEGIEADGTFHEGSSFTYTATENGTVAFVVRYKDVIDKSDNSDAAEDATTAGTADTADTADSSSTAATSEEGTTTEGATEGTTAPGAGSTADGSTTEDPSGGAATEKPAEGSTTETPAEEPSGSTTEDTTTTAPAESVPEENAPAENKDEVTSTSSENTTAMAEIISSVRNMFVLTVQAAEGETPATEQTPAPEQISEPAPADEPAQEPEEVQPASEGEGTPSETPATDNGNDPETEVTEAPTEPEGTKPEGTTGTEEDTTGTPEETSEEKTETFTYEVTGLAEAIDYTFKISGIDDTTVQASTKKTEELFHMLDGVKLAIYLANGTDEVIDETITSGYEVKVTNVEFTAAEKSDKDYSYTFKDGDKDISASYTDGDSYKITYAVYNKETKQVIEGTEAERTITVTKEKEAFDQTVEVDGVKIRVQAEAGVFPKGSKLDASGLNDENKDSKKARSSLSKEDQATLENIDSAVEEERAEKKDDKTNVALSYTFDIFDIKVLDEDGKEVEPDNDAGKVKVSFTTDEIADDNLTTDVYHVTENSGAEDLKAEQMDINSDNDTASADTKSFSYYVVEFTYGGLQYVLDGDSSVALSDILDKVGLTGEATDAKSSNTKLFTVKKDDSDKWMVKALKAFTSDETLAVTIKNNDTEIEYVIKVTDEKTAYSGGKLWLTDTLNHIQSPTDKGAGTADPSEYNLATDTKDFVIHYIAYSNKAGTETTYGDQILVVDLPTYGFTLAGMPTATNGIKAVTAYDASGNVTTDSTKAVKLSLKLDMESIGATGDSGWHYSLLMKRAALSDADCAKWLTDGKLTTKIDAKICIGDDDTLINVGSGSNKPEYIWNLSPKNYDSNVTVAGDHTQLVSNDPSVAKDQLNNVSDAWSLYNYSNRDYYVYTQGTIHDGDEPLMTLKQIKIYVPKNGTETGSFTITGVDTRRDATYYDIDLHNNSYTVSDVQDDNDGKGKYYILNPNTTAYNKGSSDNTAADYWSDAITYGIQVRWAIADGVTKLADDTLYTASDPVFTFTVPDGTSGSKDVDVTGAGQGGKIQTTTTNKVDCFKYTYIDNGYNLRKFSSGGYYSDNGVSADSYYNDVRYVSISNDNYSKYDSATGKYTGYVPNNNGACTETYEFPEEIQPSQWSGWSNGFNAGSQKINKVVYWTADGNSHEALLNQTIHMTDQNGGKAVSVDFDTSGGRVTKVQVYWDEIYKNHTNGSTAAVHSAFNIYVTPEASGMLQVKYSSECTDTSEGAVINPNDNFASQAAQDVTSPVSESGVAADDFMWVMVTEKPCSTIDVDQTDKIDLGWKPIQCDDGFYRNNWELYYNYNGDLKDTKATALNPRIVLNVSTLNIVGLDSDADKMGLLTGKFTAAAALSGWTIKYTLADNATGTVGAEQTYTVPANTADGTEINLNIDRSTSHLASLELSYEGNYKIGEAYTASGASDNKLLLFKNIEYEMRRTNWAGDKLTVVDNPTGWYHAASGEIRVQLQGKYYNDDCTDYNRPHTSTKGQTFGSADYSYRVAYQIGILDRHYVVNNNTSDNLIAAESDADTKLSIYQTQTATQKVTFQTKAWTKESSADINMTGTAGWGYNAEMLWTFPESAYVEITDSQFAPAVDDCSFLGYNNASGKVKIEKVIDSDGKVWIKMAVTSQLTERERRQIAKDFFSNWYGTPQTNCLKFMQDAVVIAVQSNPATAVTSAENNIHHYPFGTVYYDVSSIETTFDGSKEKYYSYAELSGDLAQLSANASTALGATAEKKLFYVDLSKVEVTVGLQSLIGANLYPGKGSTTVYQAAEGAKFPAVTFYPDEKNDLHAHYTVQAPTVDGIKDYTAIIKVPKAGDTTSYTTDAGTVQTDSNAYNMYLTGSCSLVGDSRPGTHNYFYSKDGGATWTEDAANTNITLGTTASWTAADWKAVTHVKLYLDEMKKDSKVVVGLPLSADGKNTTDDVSDYIGGTFSYNIAGSKVDGLVNPAQYIQGSYTIKGTSGSVWWDINEDGIKDESEKAAGGIKLELFSPATDIQDYDGNTISANTKISETTTADDGSYVLKSYIPFADQVAKITMPDGTTLLTKLSSDTDVTDVGDSNFKRDTKDVTLPELPKFGQALEGVGAGLIKQPTITASDVWINIKDATTAANACQGSAASEKPNNLTPAITYANAADSSIATIDDTGKVTPVKTGVTTATISASNTLAATDQKIDADTVSAEYKTYVFSNITYDANTGTGTVPTDDGKYYPSDTASTDTVTVKDGRDTVTKNGYYLVGWSEDKDANPDDTGAFNAPGSSFQTGNRTDNVTLYAVWHICDPVTDNPEVTKTVTVTDLPIEKGDTETFKFELKPVSSTVSGMTKDKMPMPDGSEKAETEDQKKTGEVIVNGPVVNSSVATGTFVFGDITFKTLGTYIYKVNEVVPADDKKTAGYEYDTTIYTVTYTVTQDTTDNTKLVCSRKVNEAEVTKVNLSFTNSYSLAPTTDDPPVQKDITVTELSPEKDETFTFTMTPVSSTAKDRVSGDVLTTATMPMPEGSENQKKQVSIVGGKDAATGTVGAAEFGTITFNAAGTYVYEVKEEPVSTDGYTNDTTVYTVTYKVTQVIKDGVNTLNSVRTFTKPDSTAGVDKMTFNNTYTRKPAESPTTPTTPSSSSQEPAPAVKYPAVAETPIEKMIGGDTPDTASAFTFTLTADNAKYPMPTNSTDGTKSVIILGAGTGTFGKIAYNAAGTYTYKISEVNTGIEGYTYDTNVYTMKVVVTEGDDRFTASTTITRSDGTAADRFAFGNVYTKPVVKEVPSRGPQTGDDSNMMLYGGITLIASAALVLFLILAKKRKKDEEDTEE